jgi:hypothetical protein
MKDVDFYQLLLCYLYFEGEQDEEFMLFSLMIYHQPLLFNFLFLNVYVCHVTFTDVMFYTDISCLGRGICEKYQSRDEKFPKPNGKGKLVSRLVFFANTPAKHDIFV